MTTILLASLALYLVQSFLPPAFRYYLRADPRPMDTMGARDNPPDTSVQGARSERALSNMAEALIVFVPLALLHVIGGAVPDLAMLGAQIFLIARILYVPAYITGIPVARSLIWIAGHAGLVLMAVPLFN